jgi:hypothetical protein
LKNRLAAAERELRTVRRQHENAMENLEVAEELREATEGELKTVRTAWKDYERNLRSAVADRDKLRYFAVRHGLQDPDRAEPLNRHQGIWTPGRPYLSWQHVHCPDTHICYWAQEGGVAPGRRPGRSRRWVRCEHPAYCPKVPRLTRRGVHPTSNGYALRQTTFWWDGERKPWRLENLTRTHLLAVLDWLESHAWGLGDRELSSPLPPVPCEFIAYADPLDWMHDTPLWNALIAEKRRRGTRRNQRPASLQPAGDDRRSPF